MGARELRDRTMFRDPGYLSESSPAVLFCAYFASLQHLCHLTEYISWGRHVTGPFFFFNCAINIGPYKSPRLTGFFYKSILKLMNPFVILAKEAVENFVKNKRIIKPPKNYIKNLGTKKAGVFVSIFKNKELRGCVGTYLPTKENLASEIISNAIEAAQDPRFPPVEEKELPYLSYEVYILEKPMIIKNLGDLNPKKYGIIVKSLGYPEKSGLLLPDLEGIETKEEQIAIACQKADIDIRKEKIAIYGFGAEKYS